MKEMQNFIFEQIEQRGTTFFEADYNDYGLRCEVTTLEPKKYRVELVAFDCEVVKSFICKSPAECKTESYEEVKFLKEMNEMTAGIFLSDDYELHHSWCYADSSDIERLKEHCSKYDENKHKCDLAYAYEEEDLDETIRKEEWQADFENQLKEIKKLVGRRHK
jgi:hypothetical protein